MIFMSQITQTTASKDVDHEKLASFNVPESVMLRTQQSEGKQMETKPVITYNAPRRSC